MLRPIQHVNRMMEYSAGNKRPMTLQQNLKIKSLFQLSK